jgi:hypothetical protein
MSGAELETRILRLHERGTGILKIGKALGIATALVQRVVMEQSRPFTPAPSEITRIMRPAPTMFTRPRPSRWDGAAAATPRSSPPTANGVISGWVALLSGSNSPGPPTPHEDTAKEVEIVSEEIGYCDDPVWPEEYDGLGGFEDE